MKVILKPMVNLADGSKGTGCRQWPRRRSEIDSGMAGWPATVVATRRRQTPDVSAGGFDATLAFSRYLPWSCSAVARLLPRSDRRPRARGAGRPPSRHKWPSQVRSPRSALDGRPPPGIPTVGAKREPHWAPFSSISENLGPLPGISLGRDHDMSGDRNHNPRRQTPPPSTQSGAGTMGTFGPTLSSPSSSAFATIHFSIGHVNQFRRVQSKRRRPRRRPNPRHHLPQPMYSDSTIPLSTTRSWWRGAEPA